MAAITVMAVPVKYSRRMCRASPITPIPSSHATTAQALASKMIVTAPAITIRFLVPSVKMHLPFDFRRTAQHSA